ncbi:MAG: hypothetical protein LBT37_06115 [Lactobacillaceae bacterium]|jgi:hypothetical protein|nr:hypothetical protein [Lactobacillaceae bacterium]
MPLKYSNIEISKTQRKILDELIKNNGSLALNDFKNSYVKAHGNIPDMVQKDLVTVVFDDELIVKITDFGYRWDSYQALLKEKEWKKSVVTPILLTLYAAFLTLLTKLF